MTNTESQLTVAQSALAYMLTNPGAEAPALVAYLSSQNFYCEEVAGVLPFLYPKNCGSECYTANSVLAALYPYYVLPDTDNENLNRAMWAMYGVRFDASELAAALIHQCGDTITDANTLAQVLKSAGCSLPSVARALNQVRVPALTAVEMAAALLFANPGMEAGELLQVLNQVVYPAEMIAGALMSSYPTMTSLEMAQCMVANNSPLYNAMNLAYPLVNSYPSLQTIPQDTLRFLIKVWGNDYQNAVAAMESAGYAAMDIIDGFTNLNNENFFNPTLSQQEIANALAVEFRACGTLAAIFYSTNPGKLGTDVMSQADASALLTNTGVLSAAEINLALLIAGYPAG